MRRFNDGPGHEPRKSSRYEPYGGGPGRGRGGRGGDHGGRGRGGGRGGDRGGGFEDRGRGMQDAPGGSFTGVLQPLPAEPQLIQTIELRREHATALIGVGGEIISRIRKDTRTKIHIRKAPMDRPTQTVELRGTQEAIGHCIDEINKVLASNDASIPPVSVPVPAVAHIEITPDMVGMILGSRGATVKQIRAETGAEIKVLDLLPGFETQIVAITGTADQVKPAYLAVRSLMDKWDPSRSRYRAHMMPPPPPHHMGGPRFDDGFGMPPPYPDGGMGVPPPPQPVDMQQQGYGHPQPPPAAAAQAPPQVLMLQPDGTYKAVQVMMMPSAGGPMMVQGQPQMMMQQPQAQPQVITLDPAMLAQLTSGGYVTSMGGAAAPTVMSMPGQQATQAYGQPSTGQMQQMQAYGQQASMGVQAPQGGQMLYSSQPVATSQAGGVPAVGGYTSMPTMGIGMAGAPATSTMGAQLGMGSTTSQTSPGSSAAGASQAGSAYMQHLHAAANMMTGAAHGMGAQQQQQSSDMSSQQVMRAGGYGQ